MNILRRVTKAVMASSLLLSAVSHADMTTEGLWYGYPNLGATFGCASLRNYTVNLTNHSSEPQLCTVLCKSDCGKSFHEQSNTLVLTPGTNSVVTGTFGRALTNCNVACTGEYSNTEQTVLVSGKCS